LKYVLANNAGLKWRRRRAFAFLAKASAGVKFRVGLGQLSSPKAALRKRDRKYSRPPRRDSHKDVTRIICSALFVFAAIVAHGGGTDKADPEEWLKEAEAAYDRVTSYTCVLHKQQRVAGKLLPEETILLKYRKPLSVYMKWIEAPYKGSELLYVAGWNANRIRAHRGGILRFITRNLDPGDPGLMAGNLRQVTSIGIGYLLELVAINMRKAIKVGELTFSEHGEQTVYGVNTQILEMVFPKQSVNDYDGRRYIINQDVQSKMLVRIRTYDRDEQLVENYGYENLNFNAPLTDADFNPKNPEYHF
jgi:uncharacterized protein DUF1571